VRRRYEALPNDYAITLKIRKLSAVMGLWMSPLRKSSWQLRRGGYAPAKNNPRRAPSRLIGGRRFLVATIPFSQQIFSQQILSEK